MTGLKFFICPEKLNYYYGKMFQLQNLHSQKRTMNVILSKMFGHSKINCNYCIKVKTLMDVEHWQRLMTSTTVRLCNINFFFVNLVC